MYRKSDSLSEQTLRHMSAQVPEGELVKIGKGWRDAGFPVERVASVEDRRRLAPGLAGEEVRMAREAMEEEGDGGELRGLRELARELGVEGGGNEDEEGAG